MALVTPIWPFSCGVALEILCYLFGQTDIFVPKGLMSKINVLAYKYMMVDVLLKAFVKHRKSEVTRKQ